MEKGRKFSNELKDQVRREQNNRCAWCGVHCDGHRRVLSIHHIWPREFGGPDTRANAVGLCRIVGKPLEGDTECHNYFDRLLYDEGKTYLDVMGEQEQRTRRSFAS